MADPIAQIAEGREPLWEQTFEHPEHGPLIFRVTKTPTNADWLRHAAAKDQMIRAQGGHPDDMGSQTQLFAAACAGIRELMECPLIAEKRVQDPEVEGHERIERIRYDPLEDTGMGFPIEVWITFFTWRGKLLEDGVGELKNASGESGGSELGEPSPAATLSPSTTPA